MPHKLLELAGHWCLWYTITLTTEKFNMNTQQIYDYVSAMKHQAEAEDLVNQVFQQLNPDNTILGTSSPITKAYSKLVEQRTTAQQWLWIQWWINESNFGKEPLSFSINNEMLSIENMNFYLFWSTVNV